jgi:tetratricopeptide (TPR) repeat protein
VITEEKDPHSLAELAKASYKAGDLEAAAELFARSAQAFGAAGDILMNAEMLNNQSVTLLRLNKAEAALQSVEGTADVFSAANDYRRQGVSHANRATALAALKRADEAVEAFELAADALKKAGEDQKRLQVMQLLAALHLRRLKFLNAVIALQSGLAGVKEPTAKQRFMKKLLFIRV